MAKSESGWPSGPGDKQVKTENILGIEKHCMEICVKSTVNSLSSTGEAPSTIPIKLFKKLGSRVTTGRGKGCPTVPCALFPLSPASLHEQRNLRRRELWTPVSAKGQLNFIAPVLKEGDCAG